MRRRLLLLAFAAACGDDDAAQSSVLVDAGAADAVPVGDDAGGGSAAFGGLAVTWTLERDDASITCGDVGAFDLAEVEVRVEPVAGGPSLVLSGDCTDGGVDFGGLPAGAYQVRAEAPEATSDAVTIEVVAGEEAEAALILDVPSGGRFTISWSMLLEGEPQSCEDLGWGTILLVIDDAGWEISCAPQIKTTSLFPLGDHEIALFTYGVNAHAGWEASAPTLTEHGEDLHIHLTFEYFDEPEDQLHAIFASARDHYLASGDPKTFPASTQWTQFDPFDGCHDIQTHDPTAWDQEGWNALGFAVTTRHRFAYRFTSSGTGTAATFEIEAAVDVDCDYTWETYSMEGSVTPEGDVVGEDVLTIEMKD